MLNIASPFLRLIAIRCLYFNRFREWRSSKAQGGGSAHKDAKWTSLSRLDIRAFSRLNWAGVMFAKSKRLQESCLQNQSACDVAGHQHP